jgi:hypothetical protein
MPFRRRWNAAKASKEIINILTDDIQKESECGKDAHRNDQCSNRRQKEMERGKMRSKMINVLTDDIQKEMERGKDGQRNY